MSATSRVPANLEAPKNSFLALAVSLSPTDSSVLANSILDVNSSESISEIEATTSFGVTKESSVVAAKAMSAAFIWSRLISSEPPT